MQKKTMKKRSMKKVAGGLILAGAGLYGIHYAIDGHWTALFFIVLLVLAALSFII